MAIFHDLCCRTRWKQVFSAGTHLRAVGSGLDDAVDKLGAVALSKDACRFEGQVSRYRHRYRVHIHLGRDGQSIRVLVVTACECVGADRAEMLQNITRFEISVADHGL